MKTMRHNLFRRSARRSKPPAGLLIGNRLKAQLPSRRPADPLRHFAKTQCFRTGNRQALPHIAFAQQRLHHHRRNVFGVNERAPPLSRGCAHHSLFPNRVPPCCEIRHKSRRAHKCEPNPARQHRRLAPRMPRPNRQTLLHVQRRQLHQVSNTRRNSRPRRQCVQFRNSRSRINQKKRVRPLQCPTQRPLIPQIAHKHIHISAKSLPRLHPISHKNSWPVASLHQPPHHFRPHIPRSARNQNPFRHNHPRLFI